MRSTVIGFATLAAACLAWAALDTQTGAAAPPAPAEPPAGMATFAGGCFWCMEEAFEKLPGVESVVSGYTGGRKASPSYEEVSAGSTGHAEAIEVRYDPARIGYGELLHHFWRNVDPFTASAQFCDNGSQYRPAIFTHDAEQKEAALESRDAVAKRFGRSIAAEISAAGPFYPAEEYHQDYYSKNPVRYRFYKTGCGRARRLEQIWGDEAGGGKPATTNGGDKPATGGGGATGASAAAGSATANSAIASSAPSASTATKGRLMNYEKPGAEELKKKLTPIQYEVTQNEGTEPPFRNDHWDNHRDGIYVDVVSGEPLFSSLDKFESGTGWPSFTRPLESENVVSKRDFKLLLPRTEVRSKHGDSHLGHVFKDGPAPTGLRYCMNSASLRFVPVEQLEEEGYGEYLPLFEQRKAQR